MRLKSIIAAVLLAASPVFASAQDVTSSQLPPVGTPTSAATVSPAEAADRATFDEEEISAAASRFFDVASSSVAGAIERVFADQGQPVGYIEGREFAAALGGGLRYGRGTLVMKNGERRELYWQGPSIGFDTGVNASRVFTLVYDLGDAGGIYRRYPGVEGAAFLVAGFSVTYQRAEGVTLAPIRTGVGLRAGVNAGYTAYSMNRRWFPF